MRRAATCRRPQADALPGWGGAPCQLTALSSSLSDAARPALPSSSDHRSSGRRRRRRERRRRRGRGAVRVRAQGAAGRAAGGAGGAGGAGEAGGAGRGRRVAAVVAAGSARSGFHHQSGCAGGRAACQERNWGLSRAPLPRPACAAAGDPEQQAPVPGGPPEAGGAGGRRQAGSKAVAAT